VSTGKLVIVKATWGVLYGGSAQEIKDVTKQIRDMVKDDSLSLIPTPDLLGETALGKHKDLKIEYKKGKVAAKLLQGEGEPLTIATDEKPEPVRLVVTKAVYGDLSSKDSMDVTDKVAPKVRRNTLSIAGYNGIFGDPAIGKDKQFRVDYKLNGKAETKTVGERERLTLSAPKP
jgi:hypothetical protein